MLRLSLLLFALLAADSGDLDDGSFDGLGQLLFALGNGGSLFG